MFAAVGLSGEFLKLKETRQLFRSEQYLPSAVIDRESLRAWQEAGSKDAFGRARDRVTKLVASYRRREMTESLECELRSFMESQTRSAGMEELPEIETRAPMGAA